MKYISEKRLAEELESHDYDTRARDILNGLIDECQELNVENIHQWQPIESAPKDREILMFYPNLERSMIGNWDNDEYNSKPRPYWNGEYARLWGKNLARINLPTHWMELPSPPCEGTSEPPK